MKVRNVSPVGDLDVATDRGFVLVNSGEVVEVSDEIGESLCEQPTNWVPVTEKETKE
jgi:hypothetical protein